MQTYILLTFYFILEWLTAALHLYIFVTIFAKYTTHSYAYIIAKRKAEKKIKNTFHLVSTFSFLTFHIISHKNVFILVFKNIFVCVCLRLCLCACIVLWRQCDLHTKSFFICKTISTILYFSVTIWLL